MFNKILVALDRSAASQQVFEQGLTIAKTASAKLILLHVLIDRVAELIENRLKQGSKLKIYAEVNNWSGMSLGAFIKDLRFSLQHLNDFEKEAIVSDRGWLEGLAALGNTLFSGIEVKHFTFDEKDRALEWIGS